jgi:hypothetical protein
MFSGDMFNAGSILTYPMVEEEKEAWKNLAALVSKEQFWANSPTTATTTSADTVAVKNTV